MTVGVEDLDIALSMWVDSFGLEVIDQSNGSDSGMSGLWNIGANEIRRQALVGTPGYETGRIHLVEFNDPDPPVREAAQNFDACPKNLDLYVDDMAAQVERLTKLGYKFRNPQYSEITGSNGMRVREIHLSAHDQTNVVLLEVQGEQFRFSPNGLCGIGPLITAVPEDDADIEKQFYKSVIGLENLHEERLTGESVEDMIGLPPGCGLEFSIWGHAEVPLGRIEIITYVGVSGANLFSRAKPKALGILQVTFLTDDLSGLERRLALSSTTFESHGRASTVGYTGDVISFTTPAGFRIVVVQNHEG